MSRRIAELIKEIKMEHIGRFHLKELLRDPNFNMFIVSFFTATGFLPFYVLYLLSKKDYYGQEIIKTIADDVDNIWVPNPGVIYPLLRDLKRQGLVVSSWNMDGTHPRHIYHLTDKGREEYKKMYEIIKIKLDKSKEVLGRIEKEVFKDG